MDSFLSVAIANLTSPMVLFFALGFAAALARVDMALPQPVAKTIALYLMVAIGFKGGVGMTESGAGWSAIVPIALGVGFSTLLPVVGYRLLRMASGLDQVNAAAVAAHFGSISIVTFLTASQVLTDSGESGEGILVAVAAAMEAPAIVVGLWLATRGSGNAAGTPSVGNETSLSAREAVLNSSIVALLGAFAIGWMTGAEGFATVKPFMADPFKGILCLFLLDMGAIAGRGLLRNRGALDKGTVLFGLYMPLIGAALMALALMPVEMSIPGKVLMMVLAASASYIAAPAAFRLALPRSNPAIYVTLSLGVTFPFNVVVGIPLYIALANWLF